MLAIIEIGSNNTKTHVYKGEEVVYSKTTTIEFKKNYKDKILDSDLEKLYWEIEIAKEYTNDIHVYGCSIFRKISNEELNEINDYLKKEYDVQIEVVSQEEEAKLTALGCYGNIDYDKNICIFIGGGGSTELVFVNNKNIIDHKYFNFGVVDITNSYPDLRDDYNTCTFDEVYEHIDNLIGEIDTHADILILAGGDHPYWYNNAMYELKENTLYKHDKQKYMIDIDTSDEYDRYALNRSLDEIKNRSDNPLWFDGSRAMKVITNVISHKVCAKYIVPTSINMEDGIVENLKN